MTQEELDALPDVTVGFDVQERTVDGRTFKVPVHVSALALFIGPEDGTVMDVYGAVWLVGQHNGVRVKRLTGYWSSPRRVDRSTPAP